MIITLPKDVIQLKTLRAKAPLKSFRFFRELHRMVIPRDVREVFYGLGLDMFVSKSEKSLYISFGPQKKTQFSVNPRNGYVSCKALFEWIANTEMPVFDNYEYKDYQVDKENRMVKIKLERK